ncbi:TetR/AcrR family transcriptional regulator [Pseudofrankia inefficax]|uniref:Regulatory protein TetR n=1 Tax=Pseudofrankia inefficax (strain DSM 45817 / CECT 9037 / DDB 130130 / EuI1c) TaxID=298654 RepID=E3IZB1_PSEI1|nr:TetR family transcriptional regulator [Pseudofrankia inefficax]ADP81538.1 regulatory protein TetR [Pseudofrankia inefficax]
MSAGDGAGQAARLAERVAKGVATRELILQTALASFRDRGYDQTTMRAVAQSAGVSLGNAYYYFGSKEELVQEFYALIQDGHRLRAADALRGRGLAERLRGVLHAGIDEMSPYHEFAGSFIRVAIAPTSASSPFSPESTAARSAAIGLFREVLAGSDAHPGGPLAKDLPELLWLAYLGITLFWVYDTSPGQARTRRLVDSSARMIARTVSLTRLPVLRAAADDLHTLLADLRVSADHR